MSEIEITENFIKIMYDFLNDITTSFPEYIDSVTENDMLKLIYKNEKIEKKEPSELHENNHILDLQKYCLEIYPERFFDILYKNDKIFEKDNEINCKFIPGIDFKDIWNSDISDNTKKIIWQYLQLVLFSISKLINGADSFGDATKLFEAINENELFNKLEETVKEMESMLDVSNIDMSNIDVSNIGLDFDISGKMPDPNEIHSHIKNLLDGNLGKLAHEIAEETAKDLENDLGDMNSVGDVFQKLFKDPSKLMNMIKKVGSKLDEKIKTGEIKESELMQEASDLMKKMTNMPGMKNMEKMFSKMGVPIGKNSKINVNAFQSRMKSNIRQSKQRERMLAKLEKRRQEIELKKEMDLKLQESMKNQENKYEFTTFTKDNEEKIKKTTVKKKKRKKKKNKNKK